MTGKIHRLKTVDSTNQEAKRLLAQGAASGTVVVASVARMFLDSVIFKKISIFKKNILRI